MNIDSYVEDNKISSINITKFEQTMNDKLTRTYNITYEKDEKSSTFNIELTKGENTSVKINELENTRNIRELTEEEFNNIKANIKQYINNDELINMIPKIFATKCTQDLKCVCNNTSCSCEVNDRIIECPLGTVSSSNAE